MIALGDVVEGRPGVRQQPDEDVDAAGRALRIGPGRDPCRQRQPLLQSPAKGLPRSDVRQDLPPEFLVDVGCQPSYLAWFDTIDRPYLFAPDELRNYVRLRRVSADADGTLYRIEPKAPPRTPC